MDTAFPGNSLDAVGMEQASLLPGRLASSGDLDAISSLWVSPIQRARETIAPIEQATGLAARIRPGLREVLAGDIEMNTDLRSVACYTDTTRSWMVGRTAARIPGSPEDGADTFARFNAVVEEIYNSTRTGGTALLVAHGTVLRLWTALAAAVGGGVDPAWIADHPMRNTAVSVVEGDPNGWRLVDWDEGTWRADAVG
ncbi:histidine phosphatase family protein [Actinomyces ruminis]|uniref:histidine phosphatase family protein n=1 Tax=Actinomyces ruminis TaxID=1937003 RepID=UPI00211DFDCD|nr:histidine phosphatase family protein [Actinomyces ruminis]